MSANLDELYVHDGLYRLTEMQRGQLNGAANAIVSGTLSFAQAWGLDATGNWKQFWQNDTGASWNLQQSRTATKTNEIVSITGGGWAQSAYDTAGNMVQMPQPSSPSTANAVTLDAWNRMMSVSAGGLSIQQNAYDGENRRTTNLATGTLRHYYFSAQWQSLEERLGVSSSPDRQFVWGQRYVDDLVLRDRIAERMYAFQDPNWNVTGICSASGIVPERYAYAPYGQPAFLNAAFDVLTSSQYDWETLFAGYRWDAAPGVYQIRHRVLHTALGLWMTPDPSRTNVTATSLFAEPGSFTEGANYYVYVGNRPTTTTDPSGLRNYGIGGSLCIESCDDRTFWYVPEDAGKWEPFCGRCHSADAVAFTQSGITFGVVKIPDTCDCSITCHPVGMTIEYAFSCFCWIPIPRTRLCPKFWSFGIGSAFGTPPSKDAKCPPNKGQQVIL